MTTEHPVSSARVLPERGWFTLALLVSTWIPMAFFLTAGSIATPGGGLDTVRTALLFVGGIHVAATLLLYVDRKFLRVVAENRTRYVVTPLALILASGFVFTLGGAGLQLIAYLVFWAWQTHHYGRQNVGVYAFAGIAGGWRPHPAERRALDLAGVCGICGTFQVLAREVAPRGLHPLFDALYRIGAVGFLGVLAFSVWVYVRRRHQFAWTRAVFFFTLVLFFAPMFLSSNVDVAFFSYAIAHGTQYLAFMSVISLDLGAREGRRDLAVPMVGAALLVFSLALIGYRAADLKTMALVGASPALTTILDFLAGIGLGITMAHFVIDAGAWKLSVPVARRYVRERFGFLFALSPAEGSEAAARALSR